MQRRTLVDLDNTLLNVDVYHFLLTKRALSISSLLGRLLSKYRFLNGILHEVYKHIWIERFFRNYSEKELVLLGSRINRCVVEALPNDAIICSGSDWRLVEPIAKMINKEYIASNHSGNICQNNYSYGKYLNAHHRYKNSRFVIITDNLEDRGIFEWTCIV
jgi:hypothetical protein